MAPERPVQPVSQGIQPAAQPVQPKPESSIPIYDKPPTGGETLVSNVEGAKTIKPEEVIKKFEALSPEDQAQALKDSPKIAKLMEAKAIVDYTENSIN